MPLTIPPAAPFQGAMIPRPALWRQSAPEGDKFVSMELDWTQYATDAVSIALTGGSTTIISRICALSVDNNRNGNDVAFIFPDSGYELIVPAYSQGVFPVWTNGLQFYAQSGNTSAGDTTVLNVLNHIPPPVALQSSQEQSGSSQGSLSSSIAATTNMVAPSIGGTLEAAFIAGTLQGGAGGGVFDLKLQDGAGAVIAHVSFLLSANENYSGIMLDMGNSMQVRFLQGLDIVVAQAVSGGQFAVNLLYRSL